MAGSRGRPSQELLGPVRPQRTLIIRDIELVPGEYVARATGRPVEDESRRYMVAVREDSVEELRSLLRKAGNTFDQESIYLSVRGLVEFIQPRPEDGFL